VSDGYWALVEYIGSRILTCSETDLLIWHNLYVTCVHNMPHMEYHVTELRSLWWAAGIWLPEVCYTGHQEWLCPISTQYLRPQRFLQGVRTLWVKMRVISTHYTTFYVRDVPKNTHSRMQRPKSSPRHNAVNSNALWHLQFLIPVLPLHQRM